MSNEPIRIAIVGLGTVGTGVAKILTEQNQRIAQQVGRPLQLVKAVVRDLSKPRDIELPSGMITDQLSEVVDNDSIDIVAQLIGGTDIARTTMLQLLESGKDVVTANKALLAEHGQQVFSAARELGRSIAFEAAVAGGIPIITNLEQCLSANQVISLQGILNGTSNYIITQMEEAGTSYEEAVRQAQTLGYAEADPAMDVDGTDAAQKLAILAQIAFATDVDWNEIPRCGIDNLQLADMRYAAELGYRIRLIAAARLTDEGLGVEVGPCLVKQGTPLAEVRGPFNAVAVDGDAVGPVFYHGQGAGQMPTASAVVADLIDTAVGRTGITFRSLELWSDRSGVPTLPPANNRNRFYLRLTVDDKPLVLADITTALGRQAISIASVIQHEADESMTGVPLVIMTHETTAGAIKRALRDIHQLESVHDETVTMGAI